MADSATLPVMKCLQTFCKPGFYFQKQICLYLKIRFSSGRYGPHCMYTLQCIQRCQLSVFYQRQQKELQSIRICANAVFSGNLEHSKFHWSIAVQTSFITVKTSTNFSPCPRICPHSSLTETPAAPNPDNMDTFILNINLISRCCHIVVFFYFH